MGYAYLLPVGKHPEHILNNEHATITYCFTAIFIMTRKQNFCFGVTQHVWFALVAGSAVP
jgi:hypothetical protein